MMEEMVGSVLVVDDEADIRNVVRRVLAKVSDVPVLDVGTVAEAVSVLGAHPISVLFVDLGLPDGQGFDVIDAALARSKDVSIVVMTGESSVDHPISALRRSVADFLLKPFSRAALLEAWERAAQRQRENASRPRPSARAKERPSTDVWREVHAPEIVGEHPSLHDVFATIERIADTDATVLITGESGTGKELVAAAVHSASKRTGAFVTLNCAAIPENLMESELFGHVRGAFTGASGARNGCFVEAHGGTLFLDEIGEMPLALQAKLLRALQEKRVRAVGEDRERTVDVRIVAATNRDLEEHAEAGRFREDLLYRLSVIPIELPTLRDRRSDIPLLVRHFIALSNQARGRNVDGITSEALDMLSAYGWPGNVRQLRNLIERIVILKAEGWIGPNDLPARVRATGPAALGGDPLEPQLPAGGIDLRDAVERFENALILQALERTGWNKNQAASMLQINRTTLVEKLKKKDLKPASGS
jgi:DNA-binding NtrC family response regulator